MIASAKVGIYKSEGTGRDSYITMNNGGFWVENPLQYMPNYTKNNGLVNPKLANKPHITIYQRDGAGRDSYIFNTNGGFANVTFTNKSFASTLRDGSRFMNRNNRMYSSKSQTRERLMRIKALHYQNNQWKRLSRPKNLDEIIQKVETNLTKSLINLYTPTLNPNQTIDPVRNSHSRLEVGRRSLTGGREGQFDKSFYASGNKIEKGKKILNSAYFHEEDQEQKSLERKTNEYLCNLSNMKRSRAGEFENFRYKTSNSDKTKQLFEKRHQSLGKLFTCLLSQSFYLEPTSKNTLELVNKNNLEESYKLKRILDLPNNYKQIEVILTDKEAKNQVPKLKASLNDSHKYKLKAAKINLKKWRQYLKDREGGEKSRFKFKHKFEIGKV